MIEANVILNVNPFFSDNFQVICSQFEKPDLLQQWL